MSLNLNKLANKLDEALIKETNETLTKFLNDKRMSNEKQTAVQNLCMKLANKLGIPQAITFYVDYEQEILEALEMEKKQIEDAELRGKEIIIIKHTEHGGGNK
jgi:hypothetical protein